MCCGSIFVWFVCRRGFIAFSHSAILARTQLSKDRMERMEAGDRLKLPERGSECSLSVPSCRSASAVESWAVEEVLDSSPEPEEGLNPGEAYKLYSGIVLWCSFSVFSPVVPQVVALVGRKSGVEAVLELAKPDHGTNSIVSFAEKVGLVQPDVSSPESYKAHPSTDLSHRDKNPSLAQPPSPSSPNLASGSASSQSSCSPPFLSPFFADGIALRPLRCAHASRQLTATLGARPPAHCKRLRRWLWSGFARDHWLMSAGYCPRCYRQLTSTHWEEEHWCTDLLCPRLMALGIAARLLPAASRLEVQMYCLDSRGCWMVAAVHPDTNWNSCGAILDLLKKGQCLGSCFGIGASALEHALLAC
jgi:hypothetical protein